MENKTVGKYAWVKEYSAFELFTMSVINIATLTLRIFNIYLVCCWCQTVFAAIMAAFLTLGVCSLIHYKIFNWMSNGVYGEIIKKYVTCIMLEGDVSEHMDKLGKIIRENRWAILLFQGVLTCFLKFAIG